MAFYFGTQSFRHKTGSKSLPILQATNWILDHIEFSRDNMLSFEELYKEYLESLKEQTAVSISQFSTILQVLAFSTQHIELEKVNTKHGVFYRHLRWKLEPPKK